VVPDLQIDNDVSEIFSSRNLPRLIKRDRDGDDKVFDSKTRKLTMQSKGENRWQA
jgi:hypothetical protein